MRPLKIAPLTLCAALFAGPALAADIPSPKPWLQEKVDEARALAEKEAKAKDVESWNARAKALIDDMLDWEEMTKRSLGRQWKELNDKQRESELADRERKPLGEIAFVGKFGDAFRP